MGTSSSKPASDSQHVFAADHPVRFSEGLVNSLQNSAETDSTRAKNVELIIQQRVTAELEKHLASTSDKLSSLAESISQEPYDAPAKSSDSTNSPSYTDKPLLERISDKFIGKGSEPVATPSGEDSTSDSNAVAKELEELRKKLKARPKMREKDLEVEKAQEKMVGCLKKNDRKPLDCWKEVEIFKSEVARLERSYVASIS